MSRAKMKIVREGASLRKARPGDAGYDLVNASGDSYTFAYGDMHLIPTGIAVAIPDGYFGMVSMRSGLGVKGFRCHVGIVDSGYRGEIKVHVDCINTDGGRIEAWDRFAQLTLVRIHEEPIELVDDLEDSERGDGGFGSTGS